MEFRRRVSLCIAGHFRFGNRGGIGNFLRRAMKHRTVANFVGEIGGVMVNSRTGDGETNAPVSSFVVIEMIEFYVP